MAGAGQVRPTGVTILALLAFIGGIFGVLGSLALIGLGGLAAAVGAPAVGGIAFIFGLLTLAVAIVELVLGYGAWTLRPWAWQLGFVLMAINVVVALLTTLSGGSLVNLIITVLISGIIAYYLNTPEVRRAFAAPESGFPVVGNSLDAYIPGNKP